jgi:hypothetical protein
VAQDTRFTIAVVPDTQNYVSYDHQQAEGFPFDACEQLFAQFRYIVEHLRIAGGDIAFVTAPGDQWNHQSLRIDPEHAARGYRWVDNPPVDDVFGPTPKTRSYEMPTVKQAFELIAGKVPLCVVNGNHDCDAVWTDSKHPPKDTTGPLLPEDAGMTYAGGLDNFRAAFGADTPFFNDQPWYVAWNDGGADSAQLFEAGGYRFLNLGLRFNAPNASLAWAASVLADYPGLPTILTTHDFLNAAGERVPYPGADNSAVDPEDNSSELLWQKFVSQHDQIFLVLCGHQPGQAFRVDPNAFGHPVYQVLADYQERWQSAKDVGYTVTWPQAIGDGWLRLLTFHLAAEPPQIRVRIYSTHYQAFSSDLPDYARWYREQEQPQMTDAEFLAVEDFIIEDFIIELTNFRQRFDRTGKLVR